jgi:hypothetical protein
LRSGSGRDILQEISSAELLKQVKAWPRREREKVPKAVLALEEEKPASVAAKKERVEWPDVEARAKLIFGNRILPNLLMIPCPPCRSLNSRAQPPCREATVATALRCDASNA